jgi:hypothetical protein
MLREIVESISEEITDVNNIQLGDKLQLISKSNSDKFDVTITKINMRTIDATIDKDYGPDEMILVTRKKKNFLRDFKVMRIK